MHETIKYQNLLTEDISPRILKAFFYEGMNQLPGSKYNERYVFDYEMELMTESRGFMIIEGTRYPIHGGDIVFRKPGQLVQGIAPYNCYFICFDIMGDKDKSTKAYDFNVEQTFQTHSRNPILDCIPPVFSTVNISKLQKLFDIILNEYIHTTEASPLLIKSCILQIIYRIFVEIVSPEPEKLPTSPHFSTLKKVIEYIDHNIQKKICLNELASIANMSCAHFHKVFSKAFNMTPNEYITTIRINRAKELLITTDLSVSDIALQCGIENIPYFSFLFKKHLGIPPIEFRERHFYY